MTCPNWSQLTRSGAPVSAEDWAHAERCEPCREAALQADPTLIFRRLPRVEATTDDIESMQQAVAAMRRGRSVESAAGPQRPVVEPIARRRVAPLIQTAGLAAAALAAVLLPARLTPAPEMALATLAQGDVPVTASAVPHDDTAWLQALLASEPPMETTEGLEVIQIAHDDLDLVVIVANQTEVARLDV